VAMVRATLYDSAGNFAYNATDNVTFSIVSGPGKIWVSADCQQREPVTCLLACLF